MTLSYSPYSTKFDEIRKESERTLGLEMGSLWLVETVDYLNIVSKDEKQLDDILKVLVCELKKR